MLITTVETLQGMQIAEYKGIVSCRVLDPKPSMKGGLSDHAHSTMTLVLDELEKHATSLGANAVIGVRVFPETSTTFATGTAVLLA